MVAVTWQVDRHGTGGGCCDNMKVCCGLARPLFTLSMNFCVPHQTLHVR